MKTASLIRRSNHLPWISVAAIMLSAFVLAGVGVFSIRSQRQTLDQELTRRAMAASEYIRDQAKTILRQIESWARTAVKTWEDPEHFPDVWNVFWRNPIQCVLVLNPDGSLKAPVMAWTPTTGQISWHPEFREKYEQAEQAEIQGMLEEAGEFYTDLLASAVGPHERGMALNAIARVCSRLGQYDEAIDIYSRLLTECPEAVAMNGSSLGVLARFEIAEYCRQNGDFRAAIEECSQLLRDIRLGRLTCSEQECFYYGKETETLVAGLATNAALQDAARAFRLQARLLANAREADMLSGMLGKLPFAKKTNEWSYIALPDKRFLVGYQAAANSSPEIVVFILDLDQWTSAIAATVTHGWKYAEPFDYEILNAQQQIVYASSSHPLPPPITRQPFSTCLPGWELGISIQPSESIMSAVRLRIVMVAGMIFVMLVVIVFSLYGMVFMLRKEAELSAMKSDFVSSVSHEMRTPLTTIRTIAEMFQWNRVRDKQKAMEYINHIADETQRLTRLINKVLDFSRMDSGRWPYVFLAVDMRSMVAAAVKAFETGAAKDGYRVNMALPPALPNVRANKDAIMEVLMNLLDNAAKYSPDHKEIDVSVFQKGQMVVAEVLDRGIGIDPRKIGRIFERFYRGEDELTRQTPGTGIGLAVVKHIVEAHHGRVEVRSVRGEGSVFSIILPVSEETNGRCGSEESMKG